MPFDSPQRTSTTCCFPSKVGVWAYKGTERILIHLWVTCVGGKSKRNGKTKAGIMTFMSIGAFVGVLTGISALPVMISLCIIVLNVNAKYCRWKEVEDINDCCGWKVSCCTRHASLHHLQYVRTDICESKWNASLSSKMGLKILSCLCNKVFNCEFSLQDVGFLQELAELGQTFHGYHRCSLDKPNCWAMIRYSK